MLVEEAGCMVCAGRGQGMERTSQPRLGRLVRVLVVALLGGCALALALGLWIGPNASAALACGSGAPVMQANGLLATLDPSTFNSGSNLPDTGGIFNLDYTTGKPIAFVENLNYLGTTPPSDLKLRWKFGDSGSYTYATAPSHTYAAPGTYLVYVEYFDPTSHSWQFFDYAHIHVVAPSPGATPPVAHASSPTDSYEIGTDVPLDGSGSQSQDGSALTYTWDFNDGTRATGVKVTHQYVQPGKTLVQLIVADGRGANAVDTLNLVIVPANGLPVAAVLPSATSVAPGGTVTFDASQSHAPIIFPSDSIARFIWNFGDGTPKHTTTNPTISHTYQRAGTYTMTVAAYDQDQGASGITTVAITVGTAGRSSDAATRSGGGSPAPLIALGGIVAALLAVGGYFAFQAQSRRNALIRERAMQLARSRRVTARRPAPPSRESSGQSSSGSHSARSHGPACPGG